MSQSFLGEIKMLGFNWAPRGFALCAGQQIAISSNTALFSLLGTFYGGDGVQSFKLPDLRSRGAVGQGQGLGLSNYVIGQAGGQENTSLAIANLPQHTHSAAYTPPTISPITAATTINAYTRPTARQDGPAGAFLTVAQDANNVAVQIYSTGGTAATLGTGAATTAVSGGALSGGNVSIGMTGSSIPINNLQPYLAINYVIATEGIYPARN